MAGTSAYYDTIDGHECFRNLNSTIQSMFDLASSYPTLVSTADIGDSQIKKSGIGIGYDIYAMNITAPWSLSSTTSIKGRMLVTSGVHAREYAPPELALRFAEHLLQGYDTDSDITWLLRHTEIHLILHVNPDGRYVAENENNMQRKNMNAMDGGGKTNDTCTIGVDLNRNFDIMWGDISGGYTSNNPCDDTYHGPSPESESETQAVANYARSLFPEGQRKNDTNIASGEEIMGIFVDIHAPYGQVYFPWGYKDMASPDDDALQALGRKVAYSPGYSLWGPGSDDFSYTTSGDASDYMYGALGVAAFGLEIGEELHEDCQLFVDTIVPDLLPSLLYAAKIAKKPFSLVKGPDIINLVTSLTADLSTITVTVVASDSEMVCDHFTGKQGVSKVQVFLDVHPDDYKDGDLSLAMAPASNDNNVDNTGNLMFCLSIPQGLASGQHTLFVQATDVGGYVGPVTSLFFHVENMETTSPTNALTIQVSTSSPSLYATDEPSKQASISPSYAPSTSVPLITTMKPTTYTLDPFIIATDDASSIPKDYASEDSASRSITCPLIIVAASLLMLIIWPI